MHEAKLLRFYTMELNLKRKGGTTWSLKGVGSVMVLRRCSLNSRMTDLSH